MNPIIQHDLMQARIADLHRPPGRLDAASRKHTAISRIRWSAIALAAAAMVFLAEAPGRPGCRCPPTQRKRRHSARTAAGAPGHGRRHPRLADRADRGRQRPRACPVDLSGWVV